MKLPCESGRAGDGTTGLLLGDACQRDRHHQESDGYADADVEQDSLGPAARMKDAALLAEYAAEARPPRLHQDENYETCRQDELGGS